MDKENDRMCRREICAHVKMCRIYNRMSDDHEDIMLRHVKKGFLQVSIFKVW